MASIGLDPKAQINKFHLRWHWAHKDDDDFMEKVKRGILKPMPEDEPEWKPTQRGIALNLDNLKEFLDYDLGPLLLNTIVKKDVKQWVQTLALYVSDQKEEIIPTLLEEYTQSSKKDFTQSLQKMIGQFLMESPDIDIVKLAKEMPVILSLLYLSREVGHLNI